MPRRGAICRRSFTTYLRRYTSQVRVHPGFCGTICPSRTITDFGRALSYQVKGSIAASHSLTVHDILVIHSPVFVLLALLLCTSGSYEATWNVSAMDDTYPLRRDVKLQLWLCQLVPQSISGPARELSLNGSGPRWCEAAWQQTEARGTIAPPRTLSILYTIHDTVNRKDVMLPTAFLAASMSLDTSRAARESCARAELLAWAQLLHTAWPSRVVAQQGAVL